MNWTFGLVAALLLWLQLAFASETAVQIGTNIPPLVATRVLDYIRKSSQFPVIQYAPEQIIGGLRENAILLSFGLTTTSQRLIPPSELEKVPLEGFILRSETNGTVTTLATNGNLHHSSKFRWGSSIGAAYGAYALLEELGFGFLHPLEPLIPETLRVPSSRINRVESPRWERRGWHIHTMHPLELTDFLMGMDIDNGNGYSESWESMIPQWELTVEWNIANFQNEIEFVLLLAESWKEFGLGELRKERYRIITKVCHDFGIACGADAPIALVQQHCWALVDRPYPNQPERAFEAIRRNLDWWMEAGFDFVSTENGFSEFQSGNCTTMLSWMNEMTSYLADKYDKEAFIKVHISTGQVCEEFQDPNTGQPLNFNFLPIFADPRLGLLPHTVQFYALDDPAPTYGNSNFTFMLDFMFEQAGKRQVIYYPETAYWVNFDNQVPLFLPIYALNRLRDLRMIAKRENAEGKRINGQYIFDSGWEWGYWVQDVISARAVWNPFVEEESDELALKKAFQAIVRHYGDASEQVVDVLIRMSYIQRDLLVYGEVNGVRPDDIEERNGIAYIEGWDTFADIGTTFESFLATQPKRLNLVEFRTRLNPKPNYRREVEPLLAEMSRSFTSLANELQQLQGKIPAVARPFFDEMLDGSLVVGHRSAQVHALYDYASSWRDGETAERAERLQDARDALSSAEVVIGRRQLAYRTPLERIAGWRRNPTVYMHTYLWHAKSLYYFWRDYDKAVFSSRELLSPCYMNVINPADVAFGEGKLYNLTLKIREWADENRPGNNFILDCVAAPSSEPTYPLPIGPKTLRGEEEEEEIMFEKF